MMTGLAYCQCDAARGAGYPMGSGPIGLPPADDGADP
jgi:hypothetical protein